MPTDTQSDAPPRAEVPPQAPPAPAPPAGDEQAALLFRQRMLDWPNPVEFVNNMYGCHPGDGGSDYFKEIYRP